MATFITTKEAAKLTGISVDTIRLAIRQGRLNAVQFGNTKAVNKAELLQKQRDGIIGRSRGRPRQTQGETRREAIKLDQWTEKTLAQAPDEEEGEPNE